MVRASVVAIVSGLMAAHAQEDTPRHRKWTPLFNGRDLIGHFALQQHGPETVVKFRKVEVLELPPVEQSPSRTIGASMWS
jgi:hypothetical protein